MGPSWSACVRSGSSSSSPSLSWTSSSWISWAIIESLKLLTSDLTLDSTSTSVFKLEMLFPNRLKFFGKPIKFPGQFQMFFLGGFELFLRFLHLSVMRGDPVLDSFLRRFLSQNSPPG